MFTRTPCQARLSRVVLATRLLLAGAFLYPAAVWSQTPPSAVNAAAAPRSHAIAAGPLDAVLRQFARSAGVAVSADAALTRDLQSPGLQGLFSAEDGLARLLGAHGLRAQRNAEGVYVVHGAAASASAQPDAHASEATLPTVTVTATADPKTQAYEASAGVSVITREEIDRTGPRHASEILQATPGVFTVTNEQIPTVSVSVRGLKDFGRVTMSIDGMRQNFQRSGHQQRNGEMFIDTEFLSGVQIDKGPSSGLGGLGASGGVANFQTLEAEDLLLPGQTSGVRLRGSTGVGGWANGSRPSGSVAAAIQASNELDLVVAASVRRAGAYEPGHRGLAYYLADEGHDDHPIYDVPFTIVGQTHQHQDSLLFKARWQALPGHEIKFTALHTRLDYAESSTQDLSDAWIVFVSGCYDGDAPPQPGDPDYDAYLACIALFDADNIYPKDSSSQARSTSLGLDYRWQPAGNPWVDFSAKVYVVSTDNRTVSTHETTSTFITRTDTVGLWASNTSLIELNDEWLLEWRNGAEAFVDSTKPSAESDYYSATDIAAINGNTPRGHRLLAGAYTELTLHHSDWLRITPGLRAEYARLWGNTGFITRQNGMLLRQYTDIDVDRRFARLLPSLNVAVAPTEAVQVFVNAAKGWRPPAITEALMAGYTLGHSLPINYYPNYLLEPEETISTEAGVNLNWRHLLVRGDALHAKLVGFRSSTDGYVFFSNFIGLPGGDGSWLTNMFVASVDPVVFRGWELEANYDAGDWFASLGATRLERDATYMRLPYPLNPEPQTPINETMVSYIPAPPKYSGRLGFGVRLLQRTLELSATGRFSSRGHHPSLDQGSNGGVAQTQRAFAVWDMQAVWRPSERYSAGLTLRNVFDRQYAQAMGDALVRSYAPGRTLTAFIEARF